MFAYCNNDPILYVDDSGYACHVLVAKSPGFGIMDGIVDAGGGGGITSARSSLPIVSKPNSVEILHNRDGTAKQIRWYGPDGKAERDRDNNHGGDGPFPHDHEWKDGKRGKEHLDPSPDYELSTRPGLGIGIVIICIIGIGVSVVDDTTGVGVIDDCLITLLCAGLQNGLSMIFG